MNDEQLLQKAGLWKRDWESGREGYTLAAALLLGKDEIIQQILSHYKIDALVRRVNTQRYDDRDYIDTNLIEAYERLMNFVAKHLPDKFYLEEDQRISLRSKIFREVVANLIVHQEYTNAHPATFIIYQDRVETSNANNPHGEGPIRPDDFSPFSKNPSIAKFFIQLGWVDELGSGVLNVHRYLAGYAPGKTPQFIEGNSFRMIVPLGGKLESEKAAPKTISHTVKKRVGEVVFEEKVESEKPALKTIVHTIKARVREAVNGSVSEEVQKRWVGIISIILNTPGIKGKQLLDGVATSERTLKKDLRILVEKGFIEYRGSNRTGGYYGVIT